MKKSKVTDGTRLIGCIILAAGGSRRLGKPKQLIIWHGKPLVRLITEKIINTKLAPVIVVVGAKKKEVIKALTNLDIIIVENLRWKEGIGSSIQAGIKALPEEIRAVLISNADQPFLSISLLEEMISRYAQSGKEIVSPIHSGESRNPVLFDRKCFEELKSLKGDIGGKTLFQHHKVAYIKWEEDEDFMDIDSKDDLNKLTEKTWLTYNKNSIDNP
jgi:molybdenum cofactor cytidylyltransferase